MSSSAHPQRLAGVRVLVPRPRERAEALCFLLEDEGAEVVALPLLELEPPTDPRPLQAAAELLGRHAWVAFASERAVSALVEAARTAGTLDVLRTRKLAAVGPGTAAALAAHGLDATLVATVSTGAGLAEALQPRIQPGESVLLRGRRHGGARGGVQVEPRRLRARGLGGGGHASAPVRALRVAAHGGGFPLAPRGGGSRSPGTGRGRRSDDGGGATGQGVAAGRDLGVADPAGMGGSGDTGNRRVDSARLP